MAPAPAKRAERRSRRPPARLQQGAVPEKRGLAPPAPPGTAHGAHDRQHPALRRRAGPGFPEAGVPAAPDRRTRRHDRNGVPGPRNAACLGSLARPVAMPSPTTISGVGSTRYRDIWCETGSTVLPHAPPSPPLPPTGAAECERDRHHVASVVSLYTGPPLELHNRPGGFADEHPHRCRETLPGYASLRRPSAGVPGARGQAGTLEELGAVSGTPSP